MYEYMLCWCIGKCGGWSADTNLNYLFSPNQIFDFLFCWTDSVQLIGVRFFHLFGWKVNKLGQLAWMRLICKIEIETERETDAVNDMWTYLSMITLLIEGVQLFFFLCICCISQTDRQTVVSPDKSNYILNPVNEPNQAKITSMRIHFRKRVKFNSIYQCTALL